MTASSFGHVPRQRDAVSNRDVSTQNPGYR
jgi:hypothetical protein